MTELLVVTLEYFESSAAVVQGARTEGSSAIGDEVDDLADGVWVELGLGSDFPVTELLFGRAHGGEIRLVFVPDGFTGAELPAFHHAVDGFLADFAGTSPFPNLLDAFSACRIDVPSRTSGIRDPLAPGNGADPVFGARFGKGELRRCIEVDQPRVGQLADALGGRQLHKVAVVVVNTAEYGGSGGDVAVFSCDTRATAIAIHELGHTIFNLADEYGDAGQASSPRPIEVNVAAKPDPHNAAWGQGEAARLKWAARLTPGIALLSPDAAPPDAVGAFQGAKYEPTRYWRPSVTCKMRNVLAPFCPVCSEHIRSRLTPHRPA